MKSIKKITIIAFLLICSGVAAQDFNRIEFSINAGGGMSNFQTKPENGKDLWNWTGTAGWGFHFFFNPHWGIGSGVNYTIYNTGISLRQYDKNQPTVNMFTGNRFDFLVSSNDYRESQETRMVHIPLMLQYQGAGKTAFYAALGGKAGVPVVSKGIPKGHFTTRGDYTQSLGVIYEDLPMFGFVTNQLFPDSKNDIRLKTAWMASAEMGIKWRLGKVVSLYTGIYADYGLNDILNKKVVNNANAVVYQPATPDKFAYNTALYSNSKQVKPLAAGVTLRLAFGFKKVVCPVCQVCQPCPDCPPCPPESKKNKKDCTAETDSLKKLLDEQRIAAEAEALRKVRDNDIYDLEKPIINYTISQTETAAMQRMELDEKVAILKKYPDITFYIYGHTCNLGTDEINERVGMGRAENAKKYLISKGVDASRILNLYNKRDTEPLVPNSSEANRRINRRVQLKVAK